MRVCVNTCNAPQIYTEQEESIFDTRNTYFRTDARAYDLRTLAHRTNSSRHTKYAPLPSPHSRTPTKTWRVTLGRVHAPMCHLFPRLPSKERAPCRLCYSSTNSTSCATKTTYRRRRRRHVSGVPHMSARVRHVCDRRARIYVNYHKIDAYTNTRTTITRTRAAAAIESYKKGTLHIRAFTTYMYRTQYINQSTYTHARHRCIYLCVYIYCRFVHVFANLGRDVDSIEVSVVCKRVLFCARFYTVRRGISRYCGFIIIYACGTTSSASS